jgi:hypothetical protein
MRYGVTRATVGKLLLPFGVAAGSGGRASPDRPYEGAVWTWLAGPVTYALTRYDRQDLSFTVTKSMLRSVLTEDMAGALPEMLNPAPAGARASLTGMAELVRTIYQDYLGLRVDLSANTITLQPKLPDDLTDAEFTVYAGQYRIEGSYRRGAENDRILLNAPDLPGAMRVTFLWVMRDKDAWRGRARLKGGTPVTLVLSQDDVVLFQGEERGECDGKRLIRGFSQRASAAEFTFAGDGLH